MGGRGDPRENNRVNERGQVGGRALYNIVADIENMVKRTDRDKSLLVAIACVRAAYVYTNVVCVFSRVRVCARATAVVVVYGSRWQVFTRDGGDGGGDEGTGGCNLRGGDTVAAQGWR